MRIVAAGCLFVGLASWFVPAAAADNEPDYGIAAAYRESVARIIGEALTSDVAYRRLAWLCDRIGHRLSGSPGLERAVAWAQDEMKRDGLANVRGEEVLVPVWVRGNESARLLEPEDVPLSMLGLGNSVGTPAGGITAEAVVVGSFDELAALGERAQGKIVVFDVPYRGYGPTVAYRWGGASQAAAHGAVAMLLRSVGPISYDTPHTGTLGYDENHPRIPAAAITIEHAAMLRRMQERDETIRIRLEMEARMLPDAPSANVIGELAGSERPEEIVLVGGHLDSWDVGQGAQDDGVGCIIAWEAARLLHEMGLRPRRTIRVVLFTNEENGLRGGSGYLEAHRAELGNHVAAIESDTGNGPADGFSLDIPPLYPPGASAADSAEAVKAAETARARGMEILREIGTLLEPLRASDMELGGSGADIGPIVRAGVTGLGLDHDASRYFDVHHTRADTFEKVDPHDLRRNIAIMTVMAYVLADMPHRLVPDGMLRGVLPTSD